MQNSRSYISEKYCETENGIRWTWTRVVLIPYWF